MNHVSIVTLQSLIFKTFYVMKKSLFLFLPFVLSFFLFTNCIKNSTGNENEEEKVVASKLVSKVSRLTDGDTISYTFRYNDQEQVNKVIYTFAYNSGYTYKTTWDILYNPNELKMTETISEHQGEQNAIKKTTNYIATLNSQNFATKIVESPTDETAKNTTTLTYNSSNYLTKLTLEDQLHHHSETSNLVYNYIFDITWEAGNQTEVAEKEIDNEGQEYLSSYTYEYGQLSNKKANLDLNYLLSYNRYSYGSPDILPILGYYSESSNNLVSKTISRVRNNTSIENITYEVDAEGYPIKVTFTDDQNDSWEMTIAYTK